MFHLDAKLHITWNEVHTAHTEVNYITQQITCSLTAYIIQSTSQHLYYNFIYNEVKQGLTSHNREQ